MSKKKEEKKKEKTTCFDRIIRENEVKILYVCAY